MIRSTCIGLALAFVLAAFGGYFLTGTRAENPQPAKLKASQKSTAQKAKEKEPALAKFMKAKLKASSQILEGLCTEDFATILKGAEKLKSMSEAERWRVSNDAMYRQYSAEFRDSVDNIIKASKAKKNLDSAALAWTKATLSCIECHRWVRNELLAGDSK